MDTEKKVWDWRTHILKDGPDNSTYKHLLLTLSCYMDSAGGSCFPSIKTLVEVTSLTKPTVLKYLKKAREDGWIKVSKHGFKGQRWARNEYTATLPKAVKQFNHQEEKAVKEINEGGKTDREGGKTDRERRSSSLATTSSSTSSKDTSPNNTPTIAREDCVKIFNAYPRKIKKAKALKEIGEALHRLENSEIEGEVITDPMSWLLDKVKTFAGSPAGNGDRYTPHPDNFFRDERYLDDPDEWFKNGKSTGQLFNYDEKVEKITSGQYKDEQFRKREDKTDGDGRPMWELKAASFNQGNSRKSRADRFFDIGEELLASYDKIDSDIDEIMAERKKAAEMMNE